VCRTFEMTHVKILMKFRFFEVILKEAITRYYLSFVGMWSITTLLSMLTQTPAVAMKTADSVTSISSELATRRRAATTLDVRVKVTDNTEHFILDATSWSSHSFSCQLCSVTMKLAFRY